MENHQCFFWLQISPHFMHSVGKLEIPRSSFENKKYLGKTPQTKGMNIYKYKATNCLGTVLLPAYNFTSDNPANRWSHISQSLLNWWLGGELSPKLEEMVLMFYGLWIFPISFSMDSSYSQDNYLLGVSTSDPYQQYSFWRGQTILWWFQVIWCTIFFAP